MAVPRRGVRAAALGALLAALALPVAAPAQDIDFPALTGRVVDAASLLDPATEAALDARLAAHESASSDQVVVATVPSLDGRDVADYANRLGRAWGIGTAENAAAPAFAQDLMFPVGEGDFNWGSYEEFAGKHDLSGQSLTVFGPWLGPDQAQVWRA